MASDSGVKKDAFAGSGAATANANNIYGGLNPLYANLAQGGTGYTPQQIAEMRTGASQGAGGGVAAATGQNALYAARTGNIGGDAVALDDAARQAGVTQSNANLNIDQGNAEMAEKNRLVGLSGLNSLYDTNSQLAKGYLDTANNVQKPFWQQWLLQGTQAAGQAAQGALAG